MLFLFFQSDAWTWPGTAGLIGSIVAGILLFAALVKALKDIRKEGWEPFRDKWITPRRAYRSRVEAYFEKVDTAMHTCAGLDEKVDGILREVRPNGGASLNDRVVGIDGKLDDVIAERQHQNETSEEAIFKLDACGNMVYTNCAFRELMQAEEKELDHNNYLSRMEDDDQVRFVSVRDRAIKYKMPFDIIVKVKIPGTPIGKLVRWQASPDVRHGGELKRFFCTANEAKLDG